MPSTESPTIVVGKTVLKQIEYLCNEINKVEWSGVLFYKVKGTVKNPSKMIIYLKHILLMDKGNSSFTTFNWMENGDVNNFLMDNEEYFDCIMGHIHSHHNMSVFFSSTDWSELNDNAPVHNIYLSVIVNNRMDITAKIAFTGTSEDFLCLDEKGKPYNLHIKSEENMFVLDCNIKDVTNIFDVPNTFKDRTGKIINKVKPVETVGKVFTPGYNPTPKQEGLVHRLGWDNNGWGEVDEPKKQEVNKNNNIFSTTIVEKFVAYMLRMGKYLEGDTPFDVLNDYDAAEINMIFIADNIVSNFPKLYETFFKDSTKSKMENVAQEIVKLLIMETVQFNWLVMLTQKLAKKYPKQIIHKI